MTAHNASRALGAVVLALSLGLAALNPARAQDQVTDAQLDSFIEAAIAVNELVEQWQPRIVEAETPEEQAELRDQAEAELMQTIEQTEGITVEEYQQIGLAAQADPELAERIQDMYQARLEQ